MLFFLIYDQINEVIAEKPFQNSGVTGRLWRFKHATVLERSTEVGFSLILSIYKIVWKTCIPSMRPRVGEICCQIANN